MDDQKLAVNGTLVEAISTLSYACRNLASPSCNTEDVGQLLRHVCRMMDDAIVGLEGDGGPERDYEPRPQFLSEIPVSGYDTVLGWIEKNNPEMMDLFDDPICDTLRDGYKLCAWARKHGFAVHVVDAPPIMQEMGIATVNAYPVEWLEKRLG